MGMEVKRGAALIDLQECMPSQAALQRLSRYIKGDR